MSIGKGERWKFWWIVGIFGKGLVQVEGPNAKKKKNPDDAGAKESLIFSKTLNLNLNLNMRTKTKPRELETENHELLTQTKQHMDCWRKRRTQVRTTRVGTRHR